MAKIIKSFSELNPEITRDLFERAEDIINGHKVVKYQLKNNLDNKYVVSIARQLSEGFDYDFRKPVPKNAYYRARKVLQEFYEGEESRSILIRPSKKNRKYYAQLADMPATFKVYPVPVSGDNTKFEFDFKEGRIIERGDNIDYVRYFFPDQVAFAKNQKKEINKLLREIKQKEAPLNRKQLRIQTGKYHTRASFDETVVQDTIAEWNNAYGSERVNKFVRGLVVARFHDQRKTMRGAGKKKRITKPKGKRKKK